MNHICVLLDLARIICPDITLSFHIFPVYRVEKKDIPGTVAVSNPVSRNFKTRFPVIPSQKVANPASRKSPAGPHVRVNLCHQEKSPFPKTHMQGSLKIKISRDTWTY